MKKLSILITNAITQLLVAPFLLWVIWNYGIVETWDGAPNLAFWTVWIGYLFLSTLTSYLSLDAHDTIKLRELND